MLHLAETAKDMLKLSQNFDRRMIDYKILWGISLQRHQLEELKNKNQHQEATIHKNVTQE
jgi:hypothetical protein